MMGAKWVRLMIIVTLYMHWSQWVCDGCWDQEKVALLQLKASLCSNDCPILLDDWAEDKDCCRWDRVECDATTGRVTTLSLNSITDFWPADGPCYWNMSLFLPLEELKKLNLSKNRLGGFVPNRGARFSFGGFVPNGGLDKLRGLHNLQVLDLSANDFNDTILSSFSAGFSSLKSLGLGRNYLGASANITGLCSLTHLQELYLQGNNIEGSLPWCFSNMTSLKRLDLSFNRCWGLDKLRGLHNLQVLDLSYNYFNDTVLSSFGAGFSSLKSLGLARNNFSTSTNFTSLCGLTHLQQLNLTENFIKGDLPWCFSNMTSLKVLDLSSNQFSGDIASSPLGMLTSIRYLDLSENFLRVPSSLKSFFNLSKLKYVNLDNNIIYQETKLLTSSALPRFQLRQLVLSCCGDAGFIPEFLCHQSQLQYASLSNIDLKGQFPTWLLENNTNLQWLDLSNNSLSGPLQFFHFSHLNMLDCYVYLDISSNSLIGHIPEQFGEHFPQMEYLNMSNNLFEGNIPSSFGYMKLLKSLDLSNNRLSGVIPEHLTRNCYILEVLRLSNNNLQGQIFPLNFNSTRLWQLLLDGNHFTGVGKIQAEFGYSFLVLDISNNRLSGTIPTWIGNMTTLQELNMANNSLEGPIPAELYQLVNLAILDLSSNNLSERISTGIGNMSGSYQLIMANNSLEGPIPAELCKLVHLEILDLSSNNLSGTLPSCLTSSMLVDLHLSKNRLRGSLTNKFCKWSMLVTLDLSHNQFTGSIPKCINKFPQLSFLLLNNNGLQGMISRRLCQLDGLSLVDLSHNNFCGPIPPCLHITTLSEVYRSPVSIPIEGPIEFTTKSISYSYKGRILTFMSGIDLSSNNLSGEIPQGLGTLNKLHALNLSHNSLTGQIPTTFSNLKAIESLDLSNNCLSGSIPPQIIELQFLEFFNVSYNNLSGWAPARVAQFATFDERSYKGNPFLYGEPLQRNCSRTAKPRNPMADAREDADFSVMDMFYTSFVISYVIALLAVVAILWINPYWRQAWFHYVDIVISSCYYFVLDHLPKHLF